MRLDEVMELTATMGGPQVATLSWENLVWRARHTATSSKLAPERAKFNTGITGFGPVKIAEPAPGVAAALHSVERRKKSGSVHMFGDEQEQADMQATFRSRKPCELCTALDDGSLNPSGHTLPFCFANPLNKRCKAGIVHMRMA